MPATASPRPLTGRVFVPVHASRRDRGDRARRQSRASRCGSSRRAPSGSRRSAAISASAAAAPCSTWRAAPTSPGSEAIVERPSRSARHCAPRRSDRPDPARQPPPRRLLGGADGTGHRPRLPASRRRTRSSRSRNARCSSRRSSASCRCSAPSSAMAVQAGQAGAHLRGRLPTTASTSRFRAGAASTAALIEALGRLGERPSIARLTVDGVEVFFNRRPEIVADGASLLPAPGGFLQAAAPAEAALAKAVLEHVGDAAAGRRPLRRRRNVLAPPCPTSRR